MSQRSLAAGLIVALVGACAPCRPASSTDLIYTAVSDGRVVVVRLARDHGGELEISGHKVSATWTQHSDTLYFDFGLGAAHFRYHPDSISWNNQAMNLGDAVAINATLLRER